MPKRRTFTPEFKSARVLELLSGDLPQGDICRIHQLTSPQLNAWKAEFLANAALVFQRDHEGEVLAAQIHELECLVGRLTLELDAVSDSQNPQKFSRSLRQPLDRNGRS